MTDAEQTLHRIRRVTKAAEIFRNAENFKVCDQCRSIAVKSAGICPLCHAYRWQESVNDVQVTALAISRVSFPTTSATIPRL